MTEVEGLRMHETRGHLVRQPPKAPGTVKMVQLMYRTVPVARQAG
jgi:hypothetical protein